MSAIKFLGGLANKAVNKAAGLLNEVAAYNEGSTSQKTHAGPNSKPGEQTNDPVLEFLLRNVTSRYVRQEFAKTSPVEYTETKDIHLLVGTYNVGGKKPAPGVKLSDWFGACQGKVPPAGPDIVAVGFQEIVPLTAGNVLQVLGSENVVAWDRALAAYLNGEDWAAKQYGSGAVSAAAGNVQAGAVMHALDKGWQGSDSGGKSAAEIADAVTGPSPDSIYIQVAAKQLVGVYISIWVRKSLLPHVKGVQVTHVATGFGGYLGNKGAVSARLRIYDSPLCFVCSHLTAGEGEGDELKRNADVADITKRCLYLAGQDMMPMSATGAALISAALGPGHWGSVSSIPDHEHAIWFGDLNYRLVLPDEEARRLIRSGKVSELVHGDQLVREVKAGRVFQGWHEGAVTFLPTYKYKPGTNVYNGDPLPASASQQSVSRSEDSFTADSASRAEGDEDASAEAESKKRRTPAWCDRILWQTSGALRQTAYARGELMTSDHRPVVASFCLSARSYNRRKIEKVLDEAWRVVDMQKALQRPKCAVEPNVLQIGSIFFGQPKTFTVTLKNTGAVEGVFKFVNPPSGKDNKYGLDDERPPLPAWLQAEPSRGVVPAGSQVSITFTVLVQGGPQGAAVGLAQAKDSNLDAIIILSVEDGSDMFISFTGSYGRSFLGMNLAQLASLSDNPVLPESSDVASDLSASLEAWSPFSEPQASVSSPSPQLPKELYRLLQALEAPDALATPGLFVDSVQRVLGNLPDGQPSCGSKAQQALLLKLAKLRASLDTHRAFPDDVTPDQLACMLLLVFLQLPHPLLPQSAMDLCALEVPPASDIIPLLHESMPSVDLEALTAAVTLMRKVVAPGSTEKHALAALLADVWLPVSSAAVSDEVSANRVSLVQALIDPAAPSFR